MSPGDRARVDLCRVLEEDVDLAGAIPSAQRTQAIAECMARVVAIPGGLWQSDLTSVAGEGIGLLALDGLLVRRVGIDARFGVEILGAGDLLRPWQGKDELPILPLSTGWTVLQPTRLAVLDEAFARRLARYPELTGRLVGRALQRARNLAVNMAIVHQARVDVRLHMLFWHLAERWGRVRSDGISLPLRLTHSVLSELAAARRPTVSTALSDLARRGVVLGVEDGWLLRGEPPGELLDIVPLKPDLLAGDRTDPGI